MLDKCNKETNNKISSNIQMITGASGGMLGAALYRVDAKKKDGPS